MSDRDDFFAKNVPASQKVNVKKLGKHFTVIEMNGEQRNKWAEVSWDDKGEYIETNDRGRLIAHTCYDDNGQRVFTDDDYAKIESGGAAIVQKLYAVAMRLNGLSKESHEDAVKNS